MHDICNLFGAALSRARHELGLTQVELAEKLGTTDRSISDLERGKTNPKLDTGSRQDLCAKLFAGSAE